MTVKEPCKKIVVVDDEKYICSIIAEALADSEYNVATFVDSAEAIEHIANNPVDLVLTDLVMGEKSGVHVLDATLADHPDAIVIMMTAHPTVQAAISVLKKGAYDFLIKPFKLEILKSTILRGLEHQQIIRENLHLREQVEFLKLTQANIDGSDIEGYLQLVVDTCRAEFSASAVALLEIDPDDHSIIRQVSDFIADGCPEKVIDSNSITKFWGDDSGRPDIQINEVEFEGTTQNEVMISQPIIMRKSLLGVLNILIYSRFGQVTPGEIDILRVLAASTAGTIANHRLYNDLQNSYLQAIRGLANAIEARDQYTAGHTDRVSQLAELMANILKWGKARIKDLKVGCTLHDIGKLGVPDSILNKPSQLTDEEQLTMRDHPTVGLKIIEGIDLFKPAIKYISSHHEAYNGNGYPLGLKGEEIPIEGRLLAVVDTFDAIVSDRPYRSGAGIDVAISELWRCRGIQFDPAIVDRFLDALRSGEIDIKELYEKEFDPAWIDDVRASGKVSV